MRVGARASTLPMASCFVATEKSSFLPTPGSTLCKPGSLVRRSLTSHFSSTSEQALSELFKPECLVCNKLSVANGWRSLGVDQSELSLALTLPTGQSFRWKVTGDAEYTGVVDKYLFTLRQTPTDVEYMLHNSCTCGTCSAIKLCHESHAPHLFSDTIPVTKTCQTKFSSSETLKINTSLLNAGNENISKCAGSMDTHACDAIHKPSVIVNATDTMGVSQEMPTCLTRSNTAETIHTGGAIYFCQIHGPRSGCVCLDCAEGSLKSYFNLDISLKEVWGPFVAADARFAALAPHMRGARLLRQCPLECLLQFVCSSNNHIQRISQMVDNLAGLGHHIGNVSGLAFHAFPTLERLAKVTEAELRKAGFGYRAKYIVGAVKELQLKKGGGEEWLNSLRASTLDDTLDELCCLPGIGPKVAACIALFSLDHHHAIPVDTHVWQIATKYIMPELSNERLTPKLHAAVSEAFVKRFGKYAGWAQNVLFIAELSSHQLYLPEHLQTSRDKKSKKRSRKKQKLLKI